MASASRSYFGFLRHAAFLASEGSAGFYAWMTGLTLVALLGVHAWAEQVAQGMVVTGMTDHVSWGLYIANFTFLVGVAAAAVMMVIPAYVYRDREMHDAVIVGELLAIAAIVMCLLFVVVDLGRPDRFWHMLPGIGRFNWPGSMLTWDVIVLNGYLFLNLHIAGYLLFCRYRGRTPANAWYKPFVFLSILWAVSIHTVTAFLYCGLGGRPFWNTALMAPRFLASAFVAGPAFIIVALMLLRRLGDYPFGDGPIALLVRVVRITCLVNLFMLGSEIFTVLYTGSGHADALRYLLFGSHGAWGLVPWIWSAIALNVAAAAVFLVPGIERRGGLLATACVATFIGIWIEKGMGLIIPGFIPSTLHELVEYVPSPAEWMITAGIWAAGLIIFTAALKIAVPVLGGWTPGLATGNDHIDHQHQELFQRLNALVRALRGRGGDRAIAETLAFLDTYTREHFADEEALLERGGFPGLAGHRRLHADFIAELSDIRRGLADGAAPTEVAHDLHRRLRTWLLEHITRIDQAAVDWLRDHPQDRA